VQFSGAMLRLILARFPTEPFTQERMNPETYLCFRKTPAAIGRRVICRSQSSRQFSASS
jgi:hypothetical protein